MYKIFREDLADRDALELLWSLAPISICFHANRGLQDALRSDLYALGGMAAEW